MSELVVRLTPSQLRLVNSALAYYEAEDHEWQPGYSQAVMDRTRTKVHAAMEAGGIEP